MSIGWLPKFPQEGASRPDDHPYVGEEDGEENTDDDGNAVDEQDVRQAWEDDIGQSKEIENLNLNIQFQ